MKASKKSLTFSEIEEKFYKFTGKRIREFVKEGISVVDGKGLWIKRDRVGLVE